MLLFSDVTKLLKIVSQNPVTNAVSRRSGSILRHLKTFLQTTLYEEQLTNQSKRLH